MFKIGDLVRYGMVTNVLILGEDTQHFILKDTNGNTKKVYKELVNNPKNTMLMSEYAKKLAIPDKLKLNSIADICRGVVLKNNTTQTSHIKYMLKHLYYKAF